MANKRIELQDKLEGLLGSKNVYFQPPPNVVMKYPAIRYSLTSIQNRFADDVVYLQGDEYLVTVIDHNPDSEISRKVSQLPTVRFNRFYCADGLNHFVYVLRY